VTLGNQYGRGTGRIWLDDVECVGFEVSIGHCTHNGWGMHNCGHREDVSISCQPIDDCKFFICNTIYVATLIVGTYQRSRKVGQLVGDTL